MISASVGKNIGESVTKALIVTVAAALSMILVSEYFLFFHAIAEMFFVGISVVIFAVAWNVRRSLDNNYIVFLGSSFFVSGIFKLLHALTYRGMNLFSGVSTLDLSYHFESTSDLIMGLSLCLAPLMLRRKWSPLSNLLLWLAVGVIPIVCIFPLDIFPLCYDGGGKTTSLKALRVISTLLFVVAIFFHYLKRSQFDPRFYRLINWALVLFLVAWPIEQLLAFSHGTSHFIWYCLLVAAYYLVYRAVILVGLLNPQALLFADLRKSRAALQKEKNKIQQYLDVARVIFVVLDRSGCVTFINEMGCKVLGYQEGELLGREWFEVFVTAGQDERVRDLFARVVRGELVEKGYLETTICTKAGEERVIAWRNVLLKDELGEVAGVFSAGEDITEKIKIERAIERAKHDWEMTFDSVSDLISIIDDKHTIKRVNRAMAESMGVSPREAVGRKCYELFHKTTEPIGTCPQCLTLKDGKHHTIDLYEETLGRHFTITTSPLLSEDGHVEASVHVAHDVTIIKETEAELRRMHVGLEKMVAERTADLAVTNEQLRQEINERLQTEKSLKKSEGQFKKLSQEFNALLDAIPDILLLISPDRKILWANQGAAEAFGVEMSAMVGRRCCDFFADSEGGHQQNCSRVCPVTTTLASGKAEEMQNTLADGRVKDLRAFPIKGEDGIVLNVILVGVDITERLALENETLRTRHLSSLGELAAGVAHEINNPINGIINYAQLIAKKIDSQSREHDIARRIIKEGDRIAIIVSSLLSFARARQDEEKKPTRLHDILKDVLALVSHQLAKDNITLQTEIPDDLAPIIANAHQIEQVLLNIINNACFALNEKYPGADPHKALEITAVNTQTDGQPVVEICIKDYGVGVSKQTIDRVMDPFFSTKPSDKGTGLGLSISHGIISEHHGRFRIESVEGEFTCLIIELPTREIKA